MGARQTSKVTANWTLVLIRNETLFPGTNFYQECKKLTLVIMKSQHLSELFAFGLEVKRTPPEHEICGWSLSVESDF